MYRYNMTISEQYNCIFVHIPKCGGTSINNILDPASTKATCACKRGQVMNNHEHASAIVIKNTKSAIFDTFFKFAFVRNPYDKLISEYFWTGMHKTMSFDRFIDSLPVLMNGGNSHYKEQYKFVCDQDNNLLIPNIYKYEDYENAINTVSDILHITTKITKYNTTKHETYDKYFTPELYKTVNKLYEKDFQMFGYRMEW
jgi:chondroitin 4-sulfotransferase 11